jgi:hypothetical protein
MKFNKLYENIFKGADESEVEDRKEDLPYIEFKDVHGIDLKNFNDPNNNWDKLDIDAFYYLLLKWPETFNMFNRWNELKNYQILELVSKNPEYINNIDTSKLDANSWAYIFRFQPQLSDSFEDWNKIDAKEWIWLLKYQPQFQDKITDYTVFNKDFLNNFLNKMKRHLLPEVYDKIKVKLNEI